MTQDTAFSPQCGLKAGRGRKIKTLRLFFVVVEKSVS